MPKDVFDAMHELEFAFMLPRLEAEVTKFTSIQADKRNTYRKKVREGKKAVKDQPYTNGDSSMMSMGDEGEGEPAAKRARMEAGDTEDEGEGDDTVEGEGDGEDEEVEDDEIEEEEEVEGLTEDPLEEREEKDEDEEMDDGDESD